MMFNFFKKNLIVILLFVLVFIYHYKIINSNSVEYKSPSIPLPVVSTDEIGSILFKDELKDKNIITFPKLLSSGIEPIVFLNNNIQFIGRNAYVTSSQWKYYKNGLAYGILWDDLAMRFLAVPYGLSNESIAFQNAFSVSPYGNVMFYKNLIFGNSNVVLSNNNTTNINQLKIFSEYDDALVLKNSFYNPKLVFNNNFYFSRAGYRYYKSSAIDIKDVTHVGANITIDYWLTSTISLNKRLNCDKNEFNDDCRNYYYPPDNENTFPYDERYDLSFRITCDPSQGCSNKGYRCEDFFDFNNKRILSYIDAEGGIKVGRPSGCRYYTSANVFSVEHSPYQSYNNIIDTQDLKFFHQTTSLFNLSFLTGYNNTLTNIKNYNILVNSPSSTTFQFISDNAKGFILGNYFIPVGWNSDLVENDHKYKNMTFISLEKSFSFKDFYVEYKGINNNKLNFKIKYTRSVNNGPALMREKEIFVPLDSKADYYYPLETVDHVQLYFVLYRVTKSVFDDLYDSSYNAFEGSSTWVVSYRLEKGELAVAGLKKHEYQSPISSSSVMVDGKFLDGNKFCFIAHTLKNGRIEAYHFASCLDEYFDNID